MNKAFSVDGIFGDHMVLQRDRPIRVSGTAPHGMSVTVTLGEGVRSGMCVAGKGGDWLVELAPLGAGGPFTLRVSSAEFACEFRDILIGDVWFCSGQSNMEYPLCGNVDWHHLPEGEQIAAAAHDDRLRLLLVPHAVSPESVCRENTYSPQWRVATSRDAVACFSAVGYLFGQELRRRLDGDIPIGLIDSSWGGTRIEPWISRAGFEAAGLAKSLSRLDGALSQLDADDVDSEKIGIRPMPDDDWRTNLFGCQTPTTLYNAMVAPSTRMNIRGAIWYQGCSNAGEWDKYGALQSALIEDWRRAWRDPGMPVFITQLAGYWTHNPGNRGDEDFWKSQKPSDTIGFAPIREVQQAFLDYPGSGVACAIDVGDAYDIHPRFKGPVAERLAHEAMRVAYGEKTALPGPRAVGAARTGDGAIRVEIADAGRGLGVEGGATGPHTAALKFADGSAEWADASVGEDGKSLVVRSPRAAEAVEVQYAFSAFAPGPFVHRDDDGLPLFPFRLKI